MEGRLRRVSESPVIKLHPGRRQVSVHAAPAQRPVRKRGAVEDDRGTVGGSARFADAQILAAIDDPRDWICHRGGRYPSRVCECRGTDPAECIAGRASCCCRRRRSLGLIGRRRCATGLTCEPGGRTRPPRSRARDAAARCSRRRRPGVEAVLLDYYTRAPTRSDADRGRRYRTLPERLHAWHQKISATTLTRKPADFCRVQDELHQIQREVLKACDWISRQAGIEWLPARSSGYPCGRTIRPTSRSQTGRLRTVFGGTPPLRARVNRLA